VYAIELHYKYSSSMIKIHHESVLTRRDVGVQNLVVPGFCQSMVTGGQPTTLSNGAKPPSHFWHPQ
jgi:hypothetical protein